MRGPIAAFLCLIGLLSVSHAQSDTTPAPPLASSAPLFYTVKMASETVNSWSGGILPGLIGEAYRASHEKFLAALKSDAADSSRQQGLLRPFACLGIDASSGPCRQVIEVTNGLADERFTNGIAAQALIDLLKSEPTHSARVVQLGVIFDGRFFQVPTTLYDARLTDADKLVLSHQTGATYITTYSRKLHQQDIATGRNDAPFAGKIGSKEARAHFWNGGSSPRLPAELDKAMRAIADLWGAILSPEATGVFAGDHSDRASLPLVRDVRRKESGCKMIRGDFLVARDLGDQLWLAFPGKQKNLWNSFFIEPKCGFDY